MNAPLIEQAVDWLVLLRSGKVSPEDQARFRAWCADETNERAWREVLAQIDGPFAQLRDVESRAPGQVQGAQSLLSRRGRRGFIGKALMLAAVTGTAGLVVNRQTPLRTVTADLRTGTGERRTFNLPDGSDVSLNARSAADLQFVGDRRGIRLLDGELIANIVAGTQFLAETFAGTVRVLGGRLLLRHSAEGIFVAALDGTLIVETATAAHTRLATGQAAWFDRRRIEGPHDIPAGATAWLNGRLEVANRPLAEVIERLRPYRWGFIRLSPAAATLRVHGSFPLDDTDAVLDALHETLPLQMTHYGNLLVILETISS